MPPVALATGLSGVIPVRQVLDRMYGDMDVWSCKSPMSLLPVISSITKEVRKEIILQLKNWMICCC